MTTAEKWQLFVAAVGGALLLAQAAAMLIKWVADVVGRRKKAAELFACLKTVAKAVGRNAFGKPSDLDKVIVGYAQLRSQARLSLNGPELSYLRGDDLMDTTRDAEAIRCFNALEVEARKQGVIK